MWQGFFVYIFQVSAIFYLGDIISKIAYGPV